LLDQVRNSKDKVGLTEVLDTLGLAPDELISSLIDQVETGQTAKIVESLISLHEQGFEAAIIAKQLGQLWRQRLLAKKSLLPSTTVLNVLEALLDVSSSPSPLALLEITLLKVSPTTTNTVKPSPVAPETVLEAADAPEESPVITEKTEVTTPTKAKTATKAAVDADIWPKVLEAIKSNHNTLYGIARMAKPRIEGQQLILSLQFPFHYKRLEEARNKAIIVQTLNDLTSQTVDIRFELTSAPADNEPVDNPQLETISNIFGNVELIQSED
jgi:DNA polymerase III gamma/tau subunit